MDYDELKENALRIAELMEWISNDEGAENTFVQVYSSYNGLMPILLECVYSGLLDFEIFSANRKLFVEISECGTVKGEKPIKTEVEFINEIQLLIIKYLELKNEYIRICY